VVVGLLADKLVNPTSVSLCTVKNNTFQNFVKLFTDCSIVIVAFLADKLIVNLTSVPLCTIKTTNFKVLSNYLTMRIGSSISDVNVTVRYFIR